MIIKTILKPFLILGFILGLFISVSFNEVAYSQTLENSPGLKTGDQAVDFTAITHNDNIIELSDVYSTGPVVLVFYRGSWCPYCNLHLQQFQQKIEYFEKYNARIIAISVDRQDFAQKTVLENQLAFDVVSDPDIQILEDYHLVFQVPEELNEKYLNDYHINLKEHSGREDRKIAIPATYVIDQTGKIIFAYASKDYKVRTNPEEVLQVLKHHFS